MWRRLQVYGIAGLVVLLPLVATFLALTWLFRFMENTSRSFLAPFFWQVWKQPLPRGIGTVVGTLLVLLAGVLVTEFGGRRLLLWAESLLLRLPFVKSVYTLAKSITDALLGNNRQAFQQVALVQFPRPGLYTIGFVTGRVGSLYSLFISTTPNPTSGWHLIAPKEELELLDIPVELALKLIISGGVIEPSDEMGLRFDAAAARLRALTAAKDVGSAGPGVVSQ